MEIESNSLDFNESLRDFWVLFLHFKMIERKVFS